MMRHAYHQDAHDCVSSNCSDASMRGQVHLSWQAGKAVSGEMRTTKVRDTVPPSARTALSGTQLLATDLRAPRRSSCETLRDRLIASQAALEPPREMHLIPDNFERMQRVSLRSRATPHRCCSCT